jgi:hypothetical protein
VSGGGAGWLGGGEGGGGRGEEGSEGVWARLMRPQAYEWWRSWRGGRTRDGGGLVWRGRNGGVGCSWCVRRGMGEEAEVVGEDGG